MFLPLRVGHDDKRAHADVDDDEIRSEQVEGPEERHKDSEVDHLVHHQKDQLQTQGDVHKKELEKRDRTIARLEARADIARALTELDRRNFGTVGDKLEEASKHLEGDADAASLQMAIGNVEVAPSDDLSGAREQILGLAKQADELLK